MADLQQLLKFNKIPKKSTIRNIDMPSYPWKYNSCWLDTSLELIYITLMRNFDDFAACCDNLAEESALKHIYGMFEERRGMELAKDDGNYISARLDGSQSLFVCHLSFKYHT